MKTNSEKILQEISEILYRNGKYGIERIYIICKILNNLYIEKKKHDYFKSIGIDHFIHIAFSEDLKIDYFLSEETIKHFAQLFKNLLKESSKDIANAIQKLVDNDNKLLNTIITDDFSIKVMQCFAKNLYKGGYYIDPCVGTGRLLAGLNSNALCGFDNDDKILEVAKAYLNMLKNDIDKDKLELIFSTENFLYKDLSLDNTFILPTYILDPPFNTPVNLNNAIYNLLSWKEFYGLKDTIPSEYAFLSKILFDKNNENAGFICTFSNNFLFSDEKFKLSFKKQIIKNSLIAIIQSNFSDKSGIQKLIFVGYSKLDNAEDLNRPIYLITPKNKDISIEKLDEIAKKCIKSQPIDEDEYWDTAKVKHLTLQEIINDNYKLQMPQYYENEVSPKDIKSLECIATDLRNSISRLNANNINLETILVNLLNGIKNIKTINNEDKKSEQNINKNWFDYPYSDLNNAIGIFSGNKELDWTPIDFIDRNHIDLENLGSCIYDLRQLFNTRRLRYKNNKLEIYSKKDLPTYRASESFSSYIIKSNNKDLFYKKITSNLSPRQIEYLNTYIRYYFDYNDENETNETNKKLILAFKQFSTSEEHSSIATLKALGLLSYNNMDAEEVYEKYFPYVAILHLKEVL